MKLMANLKIAALPDDKPVKLTIDLPAAVQRDLLAYAQSLVPESKKPETELPRLVVAMVIKFMSSDRAFLKSKHRS